jgi:hypothetical protein
MLLKKRRRNSALSLSSVTTVSSVTSGAYTGNNIILKL